MYVCVLLLLMMLLQMAGFYSLYGHCLSTIQFPLLVYMSVDILDVVTYCNDQDV